MKICLVCRAFPPESGISGTGTYMHSIAKCLERLGHKVIVISYSRFGQTISNEGNIIVYRICPQTFRGSSSLNRWIPVWLLSYSFAVWKKLKQLNRLYHFDMIQIPEWGGEGFFYSKMPFCPLVVKVHGPMFLNHEFDKNPKSLILKFLENWIEKSVVKKANAVIFSSNAMKKHTKSTWKMDLSNSVIIENPIDLSKFAPKKNTNKRKKRVLTVLYVGRLEYRKGIQVLIEAIPMVLKNFPSTKFFIIGKDTNTAKGGGSILRETKEFLNKNEIHNAVKFIGPQKRETLVGYYQRCDLFVMPSLFEPVGFTAIEAMACGKPVIVSANSGIAERIEDGTSGFLFEPGNAHKLATKIISILELTQNEREKIGLYARVAVGPLSFDNIGRRIETLYKNLINNKMS